MADAEVADGEARMVRAKQFCAKGNFEVGATSEGRTQGTQPPASSDILVGQRKQTAVAFAGRPGTNRIHAIVEIR